MGIEIDLLADYPKSTRDLNARTTKKTKIDQDVARQFGKEFFDGDRRYGYGGFTYMPRFWQPVIPAFKKHWNLNESNSVLDVGCAKGFMMHDMTRLIPGITVKGIDISRYAIENVIDTMRPHVQVADAQALPFDDKSFDIVISINTIHNLDLEGCAKALKEIERVAREGSFITVDAYRNDEEKERMYAWNLTAKTIMSVNEWITFFEETGYTGDYYWFIP